jgi:hypothetical protein
MVVSVPAMWALRDAFPESEFTLLCDTHPGRSVVLGSEIFRIGRLLQAIEPYPVANPRDSFFKRMLPRLRLLLRLRRKRYSAVAYLTPSIRRPHQVARDLSFFRLAGIPTVLGADHFPPVPDTTRPETQFAAGHEADLILARLAADGIPSPMPGKGRLDLELNAHDAAEVDAWHSRQPTDGGRAWVGIGPGSKMPAKRWPSERFESVARTLVDRHDLWPVVFGGREDMEAGANLLKACGRGYNAAGQLGVRAAAVALGRCRFYVGNDTGTMHLAAAAGTPCVAIFSSRDWPGSWDPYGVDREVMRTEIECASCYLIECRVRKNECLMKISPEAVLTRTELLLQRIGENKGKSAYTGSH